MNILRLIAEEKERKRAGRPPSTPQFQALEDSACTSAQAGACPIRIEKEELKTKLTPVEYYVTQQKGTERAYSGKHLRCKDDGVYTCIVCDNPIFRSEQKFDSGCGWPSFNDVIAKGKLTLKKDRGHGLNRIEASCSQCGAHVGHVFDDGPKPSRIRYCVNSASLDFRKHTT